MQKITLKKLEDLIAKTDLIDEPTINGSDKKGKPILGDPNNIFKIDLGEQLGIIMGVEAKNEKEARVKIKEAILAYPEHLREFELADK